VRSIVHFLRWVLRRRERVELDAADYARLRELL
jgi:hypothetical protein